MALKVELKPGERLIVGNCLITNGDQRTRLLIEGKTPILRERDILSPATADTPAKRIYLAVQLMYLDSDIATLREDYFSLVDDIVRAAPSCIGLVDEINNQILTGAMYKALRAAKKLIQFEQDTIQNAAARRSGLPAGSAADGESSRS